MYLIREIKEYEIADSCYFTLNNEEFSADINGELFVEIDRNKEVTYSLKIDTISVWEVNAKEMKYDPDELSEILMKYQNLIKVSFEGDYPILYIDENELNKRIKNEYREDH